MFEIWVTVAIICLIISYFVSAWMEAKYPNYGGYDVPPYFVLFAVISLLWPIAIPFIGLVSLWFWLVEKWKKKDEEKN
jgi:hypothetical protein